VVRHAITFEYSELGMPSAWYKVTVATPTTSQQGDLYLTPLVVHHGAVKANNNSRGNRYHWFMARCQKILKLSPHYVMIESTLWFDDGVLPGLLPLLQAVQRSHMQSRKLRRGQPRNEKFFTPLIELGAWSRVRVY